ncbi:histidine phosphatase superfamily [Aspergillus pseudotamarii]|uniref:Histidine phosphatase superfamily n=1 Tax=Aspergillus pseudotamarii TaxID=132259 RepID=A0A5N6SZM9_ASPPS|nr:histidine phosphatase superfamily [Aspergillus pseudotamarii]KAE8140148.1 histidine phosphatase superfamily [Aspergillus pseudotamarii]
MLGRIHLVRHAEGLHNLRNDPTIPDASLSERGYDFAEDLGHRFIREYSNCVGAIISSPLRRTIQTSLTAFPRILDSTQYAKNSGVGANKGVMLALDANLQEITDLPCNTGSKVVDLTEQFPGLKSEIENLNKNWHKKAGPDSPLPQPLSKRRTEILNRLQSTLTDLKNKSMGKDIIVVTHQGVIALLAPTANIPVGQWQTFHLVAENGELFLK